MIIRQHRSAVIALATLACALIPIHLNAGQAQLSASGEDHTSTEPSRLTPSEREQSKQWGLSVAEWRRYETIMQGIRGRLSPDISPIEALGIHARNDEERARYAEMWAKAMHQDTDRILRFQHAYDAAWKRLYRNEPLIDPAKLPGAKAALLQPGDRVLFFTRAGCIRCDNLLEGLLAKMRRIPKLGLDIYLVDSGKDDAAVRKWARAHAISPELVRSRAVTLNHDDGALMAISDLAGTVPYLVRRRGEQVARIKPADLGVP